MPGLPCTSVRNARATVADSPSKERLTEKCAEDSMDAGILPEQQPTNRLIVESDGPESDKPEATASMRKTALVRAQCRFVSVKRTIV